MVVSYCNSRSQLSKKFVFSSLYISCFVWSSNKSISYSNMIQKPFLHMLGTYAEQKRNSGSCWKKIKRKEKNSNLKPGIQSQNAEMCPVSLIYIWNANKVYDGSCSFKKCLSRKFVKKCLSRNICQEMFIKK